MLQDAVEDRVYPAPVNPVGLACDALAEEAEEGADGVGAVAAAAVGGVAVVSPRSRRVRPND